MFQFGERCGGFANEAGECAGGLGCLIKYRKLLSGGWLLTQFSDTILELRASITQLGPVSQSRELSARY